MDSVLVDSCVWIDFLRGKGDEVCDVLERLLEAEQVTLTGPVVAEVLQGVRHRRKSTKVEELFGALPYCEATRGDWEDAARWSFGLLRRGVTVPLSDQLIAAVARRLKLFVLTTDEHFEHLGVKLHPF
jgi:predicted nucleic acid-binding protein